MKRRTRLNNTALTALAAIGLGVVGMYGVGCKKQAAPPAQETPKAAIKATPAPVVGGGQYSPYVGQTYPNRVYWGVAHVHTAFSFDAGMFG